MFVDKQGRKNYHKPLVKIMHGPHDGELGMIVRESDDGTYSILTLAFTIIQLRPDEIQFFEERL